MLYILVSHGNLASGFLSAVEVILGKQDNVLALDMYLDDEILEKKIDRIFESSSIIQNHVLILTDIFGGSVNQKIMSYFDLSKVKIITGINLPLLLELLINKDDTEEGINKLIFDSMNQIKFVNNEYKHKSEKYEDDF